MLEEFRAQGLIPRPARAANRGRQPRWLHAPGTERQLISLMQWRNQTKNPNALRVLLWLDGFPLTTSDVRTSLSSSIRTAAQIMETERAALASRQGVEPAAAVSRIASTLASKRGAKALPRAVRMKASERSDAVELMLRLFAFGESIETTEEQAAAVERMLGVSPGRRQRVEGAGPWLTGPAQDLFSAAEFLSLPKLVVTTEGASDAELEGARKLVLAIFRFLPIMARMLGALFDDDNHAGLGGMKHIDENPEFVLLLVPSVVAIIRAGQHEVLEEVVAALEPTPHLMAELQKILEMPASEVDANLRNLPPAKERKMRRVIAAAVDGKIDLAPPAICD